MDTEQYQARWHIGSTDSDVHALRREVTDVLGRWELPVDDELRFTFLLLLSELVTNAYLHGRRDGITVELVATPAELLVEVTEGSRSANSPGPRRTDWAPQPRRASQQAESGRGLHLVAALAKEWGMHRTPQGHRAWATIMLPSDAETPSPSARIPPDVTGCRTRRPYRHSSPRVPQPALRSRACPYNPL